MAKFNLHNTVGDVRNFVVTARPDVPAGFKMKVGNRSPDLARPVLVAKVRRPAFALLSSWGSLPRPWTATQRRSRMLDWRTRSSTCPSPEDLDDPSIVARGRCKWLACMSLE